MWFLKKTGSRLSNPIAERQTNGNPFVSPDAVISVLLGTTFVVLCAAILSFELIEERNYPGIIAIAVIVTLLSLSAGSYIHLFQKRLIQNHIRTLALVCLFTLALAATKIGILLTHHSFWATGTAVTVATILVLSYNQRFAISMSILYCLLVSFAVGPKADINILLTTSAGAVSLCFLLKEIRTRMKLLEVGTLTAVIVFIMSAALDFWKQNRSPDLFANAGYHAAVTFLVSLLIQSLLPLIEKIFHITTSMTLLDYSDANQPLLKKLAIEAPGTYSHSLLVGSIAETAAEAIGRNGLLCRVGAYYHDIGKVNKPAYFIENEMGLSRHKELSPTMSQLIIVAHVKDGLEMAKEYGLPSVLHQFIETHHGTTLVEYFYNAAKKKYDEKQYEISESEFRYAGPKPQTKEAAIVMLSDSAEGAVRALAEPTLPRIETAVHNMSMKRLQDGQFDECELTLKELSQIETSISKSLAIHYHGRISYQKNPEEASENAQPQNNRPG
jgi:hypothetical protein